MAGEWKTASLGNLCDFRAGSVFKPDLQGRTSGEFPFVKVSDMNLPANAVRIQDANNWVSAEDLRELRAKPFPPGTVVFAKIGEALRQNRLRQVARETIIDNNMMGAVPRTDRVEPHFFYYALSQFDFSDIAQGTALPYLTVGSLTTLTVNVPPLDEQRAIAHILGTLDDKIELNRRRNQTLEAMARALFKDWFVDFGPVRAKLENRESYLPADLWQLFPDRLDDEGKPEGWEMQPLSELLTIIGGGTPKTSVQEYWGGDIPWFSVVDTPPASDAFVVGTEKTITAQGLASSSARLISKGTTIISARGTVGNLAIAGRDMTFNQSCYGLCGTKGVGDYFVYLTAQKMVDQLKSMAHGSVFSTITRQTFEAIRRPVPPPAVLEAFERLVTEWFDAILSSVEEARTLTQIRDTLLPKLISGEIRVNPLPPISSENRQS